jgi:uncharacterized Zn finger protein
MTSKPLVESLKEDRESYKRQIAKLSNENLNIILTDRQKALEFAKKAILQVDRENLNDDYVEVVADGMQDIALMILEERIK